MRARCAVATLGLCLLAASLQPGTVQAREAGDAREVATASAFKVALGVSGRRVALLIVHGVSRGDTVRIRCLTKCRKRWSTRRTVRRAPIRVKVSRRGRVRVGSQVEVAVFKKNVGGTYRIFRIRASGVSERGTGCIGGNGRRSPCPAAPAPPAPAAESAPAPGPAPTASPSPQSTATPDTVKPSAPTGLKPAPTQNSISLSWTASTDDVGVKGYSVYLNSTKKADVTSRSHNFTGLACGTTYKLSVVAYDAAGNRSSEATINAGTSACPQPPQPPQPTPTISLSRGGAAPYGWWYSVTLSHFSPGSVVTVTCRDSVDPGGFHNQNIGIDGAGNGGDSTLCYSADGPDHWVTGGGYESNHVAW